MDVTTSSGSSVLKLQSLLLLLLAPGPASFLVDPWDLRSCCPEQRRCSLARMEGAAGRGCESSLRGRSVCGEALGDRPGPQKGATRSMGLLRVSSLSDLNTGLLQARLLLVVGEQAGSERNSLDMGLLLLVLRRVSASARTRMPLRT